MRAIKIGSVTLTSNTDEQLAQSVLKHQGGTLEQANALVSANAFNLIVGQPYKRLTRQHKLSFMKSVQGARALFNIVKGDVVDQKELERRAAICAKCPLMVEVSDQCTGCMQKSLFRYARTLAIKLGRNFTQPTVTSLKGKKAPLAQFYCDHCGCSCLNLCLSKSKLFLNKENTQRPANCWVHQNYE